jgi:hypothetical protein
MNEETFIAKNHCLKDFPKKDKTLFGKARNYIFEKYGFWDAWDLFPYSWKMTYYDKIKPIFKPENQRIRKAIPRTWVDVTELVNSTKEMAAKADDIVQKIANSSQKIEDIINKVNSVEQGLQKMDSLVQQMDALTKQVELMRPPTEEERRKVLAKDSYPFSVTQDEYMSGNAPKTQTDLENRPDKLSMMDNLMNNYNEADIKNSFYNSNNNEKPVSNY